MARVDYTGKRIAESACGDVRWVSVAEKGLVRFKSA